MKKLDSRLPDFALMERQTMLRGIGYEKEALRRPQVGVASSWGEINPASIHLDKVVAAVKNGIWAAGGTPREFVISSVCTSMAGDDDYHLPHRDLVAGYLETVARTNLFDAMVFVPQCDDVIPGHLMAAARLDLPSIFVTGGYMTLEKCDGTLVDPLDIASKHLNKYKDGEYSKNQFASILDRGCAGQGACPVFGTANTMSAMAEALGMCLTGNMSTPGAGSRLIRLAFEAGVAIMDLLKKQITPSQILTLDAFRNAVTVLMAVGGSNNGVLHLQSIASEVDIDISPDVFNEVSKKVPLITDVCPSGSKKYYIQDLDEAGGLPAVMKELEPLLHLDAMTVTGLTLKENLADVPRGDRKIIKKLDEPLSEDGGLLFLTGNLSPTGALIKKSGVPESMYTFTGAAKIFPWEDDAITALQAGEIGDGTIVVVRNMGPKSGLGMMLLQRFLWQLWSFDKQEKIAIITDGRYSGTNKGCAVGHVTPEACEGGPLALIEDGDMVTIDIPNCTLHADVSEDEFNRRRADWVPPPKFSKGKGYLNVYTKLAQSANKGASWNYDAE